MYHGHPFWRYAQFSKQKATRRKPEILIGSDPTNSLFGDAGLNLLDKAHGGDDTLLTFGSGNSMAMLEGILPTVRREAMTY